MHDSGERQAFDTGAVRDTATGKPRIELISPLFMVEVDSVLHPPFMGKADYLRKPVAGPEGLVLQLWKVQADPTVAGFCMLAALTADVIDPQWKGLEDPQHFWMSPRVTKRLGDWLARGAEKYSARNWEAGIPIERSLASCHRHLDDWRFEASTPVPTAAGGDDHPIATLCNLMFIIHTMKMVGWGNLDERLGELPRYAPPAIATQFTIEPWRMLSKSAMAELYPCAVQDDTVKHNALFNDVMAPGSLDGMGGLPIPELRLSCAPEVVLPQLVPPGTL